MTAPDLLQRLEGHTVALNDWMFAEGAGLDAPAEKGDTLGARLAELYTEALAAGDPLGRGFMVDGWAEARQVAG